MALADYRLCDVCGSKAFYDARLNYGQTGDGGLNTISNGEVICPNCHRVAHEQSGGGEA